MGQCPWVFISQFPLFANLLIHTFLIRLTHYWLSNDIFSDFSGFTKKAILLKLYNLLAKLGHITSN